MINEENKISLDRHYNSIDLFKFIMAFVVIAIHTKPFVNCENDNFLKAYDIFVNLAVPFFFLATGYLLAVKMKYPFGNEKDSVRLKKYILKFIKMYFIWTLIYLPLAIYHFISSGTSFINALSLYVRGFIFVGEQYNSWQLWYLLSTIYSLIIIYIILKSKKNSAKLVGVSVIASIISIGFMVLINYEGNSIFIKNLLKIKIIDDLDNGRIFRGMIYIPVGMLMAHKKIPKTINYFCFILGFILNYFIDNLIISSYLLIVIAISLFGIIEKIELKNRPIYSKLRNMSTIIYFIHMYVWSFYYKIVYGYRTYGLDSFIVTALISAVVSIAYITLYKNRKSRSIE